MPVAGKNRSVPQPVAAHDRVPGGVAGGAQKRATGGTFAGCGTPLAAATAPTYEARNGLAWVNGQRVRGCSAALLIYETPFHLATMCDTGITCVEQPEGLGRTRPSGRDAYARRKQKADTFMPIHPGAARFYRDQNNK